MALMSFSFASSSGFMGWPCSCLKHHRNLVGKVSTRYLKVLLSSLLLVTLTTADASAIGHPSSPLGLKRLVSTLYIKYAWAVVFSISAPVTPAPLEDESKTELEKFFTPDLARAIQEDAACKTKTMEICKIDFVLLFASQDPSAHDLTVDGVMEGQRVRVCFNEHDESRKCLVFVGKPVKGSPRIANILYPGQPSLREVLNLPVP